MPKPRKNPYQQDPEPVPGSSAHPPAPPRSALQAQLMRIGGIGTDFALAVVITGLLGWVVDWALGTSPWLLMVCLFIGIIAGFYRFVRAAMAENRKAGQRYRAGE